MIPYRHRYAWVLRDFEEGLESWARYPCGLTAEGTDEQNIISEPLWRAYLQLIRAYGKRFTRLIGKGWKGPHGWNGRWHITGEFLAMAPGRRTCERAAIYSV